MKLVNFDEMFLNSLLIHLHQLLLIPWERSDSFSVSIWIVYFFWAFKKLIREKLFKLHKFRFVSWLCKMTKLARLNWNLFGSMFSESINTKIWPENQIFGSLSDKIFNEFSFSSPVSKRMNSPSKLTSPW